MQTGKETMKRKALVAMALAVVTAVAVMPAQSAKAAKEYEDLITGKETVAISSGLKGTEIVGYGSSALEKSTLVDIYVGASWGLYEEVEFVNNRPSKVMSAPVAQAEAFTESDIEGYHGNFWKWNQETQQSESVEADGFQLKNKKIILDKNLPDKTYYYLVCVKPDGSVVTGDQNPKLYVQSKLISFGGSYDAAAGKIYSYTYDTSVDWSINNGPEFYGSDMTKIANKVEFHTEDTFYGSTAYCYTFDVTNAAELEMGQYGAYVWEKINDGNQYSWVGLKDDLGTHTTVISKYVSASEWQAKLEEWGMAGEKNYRGETFAEFLQRTQGEKRNDKGYLIEGQNDPSKLNCVFTQDAAGKTYWYEGGVKQGTYDDPKGVMGDGSIRGREIMDAKSKGWYWLDSVYAGARALNKEVWMPYIYQDEAKWSEEEIKANAAASGNMAAQVERDIKAGTGKWVRYDANGAMFKGWYTVDDTQKQYYPEEQHGKTYYYDPKTGLMAKGDLEIDGKVYHFDEKTGVLAE